MDAVGKLISSDNDPTSCNGQQHKSHHTSMTTELCRRIRLAVYFLLVSVLFQQHDSIAGYGTGHARSVGGIAVGVEAVENPKWRPQLGVAVAPKMSVLYYGKSVAVKCVVTGWTRSILENSQLRVGFYYEVEPKTSVPLTSSLPGVTSWTDQHDHPSPNPPNTDHDDVGLNAPPFVGGPYIGRHAGRRDRSGLTKATSGRHVQIVRHLVIDGEAYRFFRRGNNLFYCAATDRRSGIRHVDYFTITKI